MPYAHNGGGAFLEAGAEPSALAPVRPIASHDVGLSQEMAEEVVITEEGEIAPRDGVERMATEREANQGDTAAQHPVTRDEDRNRICSQS